MLAFNFSNGTFAYKRLAKCLSGSVSAFLSFIRKNLDPVVKADQFAQYVDHIEIAGNNETDFIRNTREVFQCIRHEKLKLAIEKCRFRVRQIEFLVRPISPEGISPKLGRFTTFLTISHSPNKKTFQRCLGFVNYYRN